MLETVDYFIYAMPAIALAAWAQIRLTQAYRTAAKLPATSGLTGAETARTVLAAAGAPPVPLEPARGELCNHYDAQNKVLRLSADVYNGQSLVALGIAAHEAAHALQQASHDRRLVIRNAVVPIASLGSQICWMLITAGFLLGMSRFVFAGLALFVAIVILQLINVPFELAASRRGRSLLISAQLIEPEEETAVNRVLDCTAWSYVALALFGVVTIR